MTRRPRLLETQPQQGQHPAQPLGYDQSQGKSIVVTSPQGERLQAQIGPYHGAENGFEVRLNMQGGYRDGLSAHLQRQGWQIPKIAPQVNQSAKPRISPISRK